MSNQQPTRYYCFQQLVGSAWLQILPYDKHRTAYTIVVKDHDLLMSVDPAPKVTDTFYMVAKIPLQFDLVHGYDTRMPVYMLRASDNDGTVSVRVDSQEDTTKGFEGV